MEIPAAMAAHTLSVLIPLYNEEEFVGTLLERVLSAPLPEGVGREIIVVDDGSTDGSAAIVEQIAAAHPAVLRFIRQPRNQGKGAAIRTAIEHATGEFSIIQDADLEYDPREYGRLLAPLLEGKADAVYGSRFVISGERRVLYFWHSVANHILTLMCNIVADLNLTDMETCYKAFRTSLLQSIPIRSDRFGLEPELTIKLAKRRVRVYETAIDYHGRTYEEGKKIGWKDGVKALGVILHFWLIDDLYVEPYGRAFLNNLTGTPQYLSWLTRKLRPFLADTVLELGAGIGNITSRLMGRRLYYLAGEKDPLYLHALRNRFLRTPNVDVRKLDPSVPADFQAIGREFDSALCVNVLEYLDDPGPVLDSLRSVLKPGGSLIVLVPQGKSLYGTIDQTLGHRRRFDEAELRALLEQHGFTVTEVAGLNKIGKPAWWLYGKLLRQKRINKVTLKLFDKTVWFWRSIEGALPWRALSLIVVAVKRSS
jgi:glycosyltransferase involved in cell wall biosynthesis